MSKILALDTSTEACSVALCLDGEVMEDFQVIPRRHAERILPMVQEIMDRTGTRPGELNTIAFGRGPGSFTGLRIATGVAQGLGFGLSLPVIPISTLAALARQAHRNTGACVIASALDAGIEEIYWGCFQARDENIEPLHDERLTPPEDLVLPADAESSPWFAAGNGWRFRGRMSTSVRNAMSGFDWEMLPRASDVAVLAVGELAAGNTGRAESARPVYLRDNVARPG